MYTLLFLSIVSEIIRQVSENYQIVNGTIDNNHRNVAAIEENLIQFRDSATLRRCLALRYVLQQHVYEIVKALQRSHNFLIIFHNNVYPRTDTLVNQLCK